MFLQRWKRKSPRPQSHLIYTSQPRRPRVTIPWRKVKYAMKVVTPPKHLSKYSKLRNIQRLQYQPIQCSFMVMIQVLPPIATSNCSRLCGTSSWRKLLRNQKRLIKLGKNRSGILSTRSFQAHERLSCRPMHLPWTPRTWSITSRSQE